MFRRTLTAFAIAAAFGLSAAAQATTFGYGFLVDFQNGDGAIGAGHLFATDNGDNTFTVTGADGAAANVWFAHAELYAEATISGIGASFFAPEGSIPTITLGAGGVYSFDNLVLFGDGRFYDFSHDEDGDLIGIVGEVGGPAQFEFGLVDDASPLPEATTWGMMVMGFGATGASMRRRTKVSFA